ncbi:MAG: HAD hydrolase family protein [candidate division KSB1 bacterium]|nr:HAD hydrolase family protein [candidate division KSB1 bacterium]MDZ7364581.1 HAD hydrolase family protein [candidate division KSB1 bacterium]MDZ7402671.1 HAD hydrolase family protein [candidate division KSB1 bacterium]
MLDFTDLDGTLLDHDTCDFSPALPALEALRAAQVPLILCSSKTHAEMKSWRERPGINHPFIAESGGALVVPKNCFARPHDPGAQKMAKRMRVCWRRLKRGLRASPAPLAGTKRCWI